MTDALPPNDPEMERAIIGCILQKPEVADECAARFRVGGDVFFDLRNRKIYERLITMRQANDPIDFVTVVSKLAADRIFEEIGGRAYLDQCDDDAVSPANFEFYADKVSEAYMLRRAVLACSDAVGDVYESRGTAEAIISGIETKLAVIRELRGTDEIVSSRAAATWSSIRAIRGDTTSTKPLLPMAAGSW